MASTCTSTTPKPLHNYVIHVGHTHRRARLYHNFTSPNLRESLHCRSRMSLVSRGFMASDPGRLYEIHHKSLLGVGCAVGAEHARWCRRGTDNNRLRRDSQPTHTAGERLMPSRRRSGGGRRLLLLPLPSRRQCIERAGSHTASDMRINCVGWINDSVVAVILRRAQITPSNPPPLCPPRETHWHWCLDKYRTWLWAQSAPEPLAYKLKVLTVSQSRSRSFEMTSCMCDILLVIHCHCRPIYVSIL